MVAPFSSIYTKSYRNFERDDELEVAKPCLYFSDLKENFLPLEDSKDIYNAERDEALLKEVNLRRLVTTYQKYYCLSEGKKSMVIDPNNLDEDEYMVYFNHYYAKKTQAVPRPLLTSRRVFGYCRFENYYTGKTTYQLTHGLDAYKYFKKDYDEGKSRLFRKKQLEMQRLANRIPEDKSEEMKEDKSKEGKAETEGGEEAQENPPEKSNHLKEKVCAICCEKFSDFSYGCEHESDAQFQNKREEKKTC